jgi:hypothetical protein
MKRHILRTSLTIVLALTITQVEALGQNESHNSRRPHGIEGVWNESVTFRRCDTGNATGTDHAMVMFIRGGTLVQAADHLASPGLGTWRPLEEGRYTSIFQLFRLNADGSLAGRSKATRDIELNENADEFTGTSVLEVFDASDKLIFTVCATETATRLD